MIETNREHKVKHKKKKKIDICLQAERQATGSVCVVGPGSPTSQSFLCLGGD